MLLEPYFYCFSIILPEFSWNLIEITVFPVISPILAPAGAFKEIKNSKTEVPTSKLVLVLVYCFSFSLVGFF